MRFVSEKDLLTRATVTLSARGVSEVTTWGTGTESWVCLVSPGASDRALPSVVARSNAYGQRGKRHSLVQNYGCCLAGGS